MLDNPGGLAYNGTHHDLPGLPYLEKCNENRAKVDSNSARLNQKEP